MNVADIIVIVILAFFTIKAFSKGFINACFGFVPMLFGLLCAYKVSPFVSKFIRGTGLFSLYSEKLRGHLNLEGIINANLGGSQTDIINNMSVPSFLKESLIENNNSVVHGLLNVSGVEEYISGYIANICVNIISIVVVYLIAILVANLVLKSFDALAQLPVLNFANKILGMCAGFIEGVVWIWIGFLVLTYFCYNPSFTAVFDSINASSGAIILYNNNWLLYLILKIFT